MMQSDHNTSDHTTNNATPSLTPDQKIQQDLTTLADQIALCQSMLSQCPTPSSIDANESLLSVIGFLEACVPRMVELIQVGAGGGALGETVFEECLVVNDRLRRVLADVEKDPKDRSLLVVPEDDAVKEPEVDLSEGLGELKVGDSSGDDTTAVKAADPFAAAGTDLLAPTPMEEDPFSILDDGETKPAAVGGGANTVEEDEDFDAFFKDRTAASGSKED